MWQDDDLVMLSALQHYQFCPRQCALIHIEEQWDENYLTASGRILHESVDSGRKETRSDLHIATSLRLVSHRLGIMGVADLVEFNKVDAQYDENGRVVAACLPHRNGWWKPFPVEYKHGKPKIHRADEVQLCAQALCLEEMLNVTIPQGALFYGSNRRRKEVIFDNELRNITTQVAWDVHELIERGELPPAVPIDGCKACSLVDNCYPKKFRRECSVSRWLETYIEEERHN